MSIPKIILETRWVNSLGEICTFNLIESYRSLAERLEASPERRLSLGADGFFHPTPEQSLLEEMGDAIVKASRAEPRRVPVMTNEEYDRLSIEQARTEKGVTEPSFEAHCRMTKVLIERTPDEFGMNTMDAYTAALLVIEILKVGGP